MLEGSRGMTKRLGSLDGWGEQSRNLGLSQWFPSVSGLARGELVFAHQPNVLAGLATHERPGCAESLLRSAALPPGRFFWGKKFSFIFCYQGLSCTAPVWAGNK